MADDRAYRIVVQFDNEHERFRALVPELGIESAAETRAEAIEAAEAAIEQKYEAAATDSEGSLPPPVDVEEVPSSFTIDLAQPLARELKYHAARSNMTAQALAEQLLVRAIGLLNAGLKPPPRHRPEKAAAEPEGRKKESDSSDRGDRQERGGRKGRGRGRSGGRRGEGYRPEIEDQANFLAYVRDMEKGGGRRR